ncbi:MAG: hydroxysqualene dehydroxylase HpnE [Proteobacteria bacterium]|nr:hydroxysqualene dehydroxylase HpnE [Pseudomonadota bacterium]
MTQVAIVGAGYAGMAAAVELAARGISVTVFEASRVVGGRARAMETHGVTVDNGQHILIGAYSETLRLMRQVGADPQRLLLRLPLILAYPRQLRIAAPCLPAPLHLTLALLSAQGLSWPDKFAAVRFMQTLRRDNFRLRSGKDDYSVSALLDAHRQPDRLRSYLWEPLCVAALNTPAEAASAQVFLNVLRDSLAAGRSCSDLLLPRVDLGAMFPVRAADYITAQDGKVVRDTAIRGIERPDSDTYTLLAEDGSRSTFSHVIIATAPYHVPALIENLTQLDALRHTLGELRYEPIITCYLGYPQHIRLPEVMLGHANGVMQWLFDRGQLGGPPGLLAAVISARGRHLELSNDELTERIHAEIAGIVPNLSTPQWSQVITEKRATFSCTPGLARPASTTPLPGLLLAGDYVAGDYPATLESAVRSGVQAAASILRQAPAD